ncbi:MAG: histone deacetylase [Anaerolineales bacterium]|jgi:acetoin utilization deacetylase AcuC-like enzyme
MPEQNIAYTLVASPEHDLATHPENSRRFQHLSILNTLPFAERLLNLEADPAPESAVTEIHSPEYLQALEQAVASGPGYIDYAPTYVTTDSYQSAYQAAGGTLAVLKAVLTGQARSGFALVRPPGHHATANRAMGFCLFNNVAIAARQAQTLGKQRVMIVDIDVHHGNGTQDIFESDPDVLYLSTHQQGSYPNTGRMDEIGVRKGEGTVVNIPLPAGAGDLAFEQVADRIMLPLGRRFSPDIILMSVGFDSHWRDPLASLQLSCAGYYQLTKRLVALADEVCDGMLLAVLEGGYDPLVVAHGAAVMFHAFAGAQAPEDSLGPAQLPPPEVDALLANVASLHHL